jgi:ribosomal protein S18 acetylase RimI-like enzyme
MPADVVVRPLDPATELEGLRPLWLALRDHHGSITPAWGPVRDDEDSWGRRSKDYATWLTEEDAFCLVALAPGAGQGPFLGYLLGTVNAGSPTWSSAERFCYVETLSVLPEARGRGVGQALLQAARERLAGIGVQRIELTAVAANAGARRFYEREGFDVAFVTLRSDGPPAG